MSMIYLWIVLLSIVSGVGYRCGGYGNEGRIKYPNLPTWFFDTKARDILCAFCAVIAYGLLQTPFSFFADFIWLAYLFSFLLTFGALTTYWDFIFIKDNYWVHGFMIGLAFFPLAIVTGDWIVLAIRSLVLAVGMGLWSLYNKPIGPWGEDETEEFGRGFLIPISLLLYLL
jgi:hypothetical protein